MDKWLKNLINNDELRKLRKKKQINKVNFEDKLILIRLYSRGLH